MTGWVAVGGWHHKFGSVGNNSKRSLKRGQSKIEQYDVISDVITYHKITFNIYFKMYTEYQTTLDCFWLKLNFKTECYSLNQWIK